MYEQNEWSKGFYLYMMALCQVKLGKLADAIKVCRCISAALIFASALCLHLFDAHGFVHGLVQL
jgi:hypothetical protein